ncbi:MAG: hypothetical protein Q4G39_07975 [Brachymonas sp.]|nr:hypothetical protein [Brachymonas sp.]
MRLLVSGLLNPSKPRLQPNHQRLLSLLKNSVIARSAWRDVAIFVEHKQQIATPPVAARDDGFLKRALLQ